MNYHLRMPATAICERSVMHVRCRGMRGGSRLRRHSDGAGANEFGELTVHGGRGRVGEGAVLDNGCCSRDRQEARDKVHKIMPHVYHILLRRQTHTHTQHTHTRAHANALHVVLVSVTDAAIGGVQLHLQQHVKLHHKRTTNIVTAGIASTAVG